MTRDHDLYVKLRDESFASYARRHPSPAPYDEEVRRVIRGVCYDFVWGDPYGENLWPVTSDQAADAQRQGARDPILDLAASFSWFDGKPFYMEQRFSSLETAVENVHATDYPAAIRILADVQAMQCLLDYKKEYKINAGSMSVLPRILALWSASYQELIREGVPNSLIFGYGVRLQERTAYDMEGLNLVVSEEDRDFNATAPDHPIRWALDGDYHLNAAWCSRGGGFANTVTDEGWRGFHDELALARQTLEKGYSKHPDEERISRLMIRVVQGQETGEDEMETWFQRAVTADPDDYEVYAAKEWFLQPRWYGTVEDQMTFGQACVKTQNWENCIPMILPLGIRHAAELELDLLQRSDIWEPVEKTYRDFLARYPASTLYRTHFAMQAYAAGHRDVAREQCEILGDNWDRSIISEDEYLKMTGDLKNH
jgi:hypothetical protein